MFWNMKVYGTLLAFPEIGQKQLKWKQGLRGRELFHTHLGDRQPLVLLQGCPVRWGGGHAPMLLQWGKRAGFNAWLVLSGRGGGSESLESWLIAGLTEAYKFISFSRLLYEVLLLFLGTSSVMLATVFILIKAPWTSVLCNNQCVFMRSSYYNFSHSFLCQFL